MWNCSWRPDTAITREFQTIGEIHFYNEKIVFSDIVLPYRRFNCSCWQWNWMFHTWRMHPVTVHRLQWFIVCQWLSGVLQSKLATLLELSVISTLFLSHFRIYQNAASLLTTAPVKSVPLGSTALKSATTLALTACQETELVKTWYILNQYIL